LCECPLALHRQQCYLLGAQKLRTTRTCAVKSHSCALATFQSYIKAREQGAI